MCVCVRVCVRVCEGADLQTQSCTFERFSRFTNRLLVVITCKDKTNWKIYHME